MHRDGLAIQLGADSSKIPTINTRSLANTSRNPQDTSFPCQLPVVDQCEEGHGLCDVNSDGALIRRRRAWIR